MTNFCKADPDFEKDTLPEKIEEAQRDVDKQEMRIQDEEEMLTYYKNILKGLQNEGTPN